MSKVLPQVDKRAGKRIATHPRLLKTRIAKWLEAEMAERDLAQLELSSMSKGRISQGYINGILRAGRLPDDGKVRLLATLLHTAADDVLTLVYLDRVERMLESAPGGTRAIFGKIMRAG